MGGRDAGRRDACLVRRTLSVLYEYIVNEQRGQHSVSECNRRGSIGSAMHALRFRRHYALPFSTFSSPDSPTWSNSRIRFYRPPLLHVSGFVIHTLFLAADCRAFPRRSRECASAFCAGTRYPDSPAVRSLETGGEGHGRGADLIAHGRAEWTAAWSGSLARVKRTRGRAVEREARLGNGRDAGGWARRNNGVASGARCGESAALCSGQWTLRTHETGGSRIGAIGGWVALGVYGTSRQTRASSLNCAVKVARVSVCRDMLVPPTHAVGPSCPLYRWRLCGARKFSTYLLSR